MTRSLTALTRPRFSASEQRIATISTAMGAPKPVARQRTFGSAARARSQHPSTIAIRTR